VYVLIHSDCYSKIPDCVCTQQKCIVPSFGGWKVQDQGTSGFSVWEDLTFCKDGTFFYVLTEERAKGLCESSFIRELIHSWGESPYDTQRPHLLILSSRGLGFNIWTSGGRAVRPKQGSQKRSLVFPIYPSHGLSYHFWINKNIYPLLTSVLF
jgi:hypothetical protein